VADTPKPPGRARTKKAAQGEPTKTDLLRSRIAAERDRPEDGERKRKWIACERWWFRVLRGYGAEMQVMAALRHFADDDTGECFPSVKTLAIETGLAKSRVSAALSVLTEIGLVGREYEKHRSTPRYSVRRAVPEAKGTVLQYPPPVKGPQHGSPTAPQHGSPTAPQHGSPTAPQHGSPTAPQHGRENVPGNTSQNGPSKQTKRTGRANYDLAVGLTEKVSA
jgi:hypothetical protein